MKQRGKILFLVSALAFILISLSNFSQAGTLKVTEEHPFLINGSWIPASDLKIGDELTTIDGKKVRITNIQDIETKEPFPVYNLEAGKYHDFVVDGGDGVGVVVHNSDSPFSFKSQDMSPFQKGGVKVLKVLGVRRVIGEKFVIDRTFKTNERVLHFLPGKTKNPGFEDVNAIVGELMKPRNANIKYTGVTPSPQAQKGFRILELAIKRKFPSSGFTFKQEPYVPSASMVNHYQKGVTKGFYPAGDSWIKFTIESPGYSPGASSFDVNGLFTNPKTMIPTTLALELTYIYVTETMGNLINPGNSTTTP